MEVRRLRLLRELAVHGTIAATAEALHLTGPAVSQQLAALEREAGTPLLVKQGRTLRFTPAGRLLVEHAEVILGNLAAAEAELQSIKDGGHGQVRIAAFPSAARVLLPGLWSTATDGRPAVAQGLDLRIVEHEPDRAVEALRRGEVEVAVVHAYSLLPRELPPGCESRHLLNDPVLLAVPTALGSELGLAPGDVADLSRFAAANWLLPDRSTSCHEMARRACGAVGFVPNAIAAASDFAVLTALVGAGAGVALVPRMALPADVAGVGLHPLTQPVERTVFALTGAGDAGRPVISRVLAGLHAAATGVPDRTRPVVVSTSADPKWLVHKGFE